MSVPLYCIIKQQEWKIIKLVSYEVEHFSPTNMQTDWNYNLIKYKIVYD
jgi:hypothetical protein